VQGRTRDLTIEHIGIICWSGREAERLFCGEIHDGGDRGDLAMVRDLVSQIHPEIMHAFQIDRLRQAAAHLVTQPWAKERIERLAAALIEHGTLDADQIYTLTASRIRPANYPLHGPDLHRLDRTSFTAGALIQ
jgi:hypothetical protein